MSHSTAAAPNKLTTTHTRAAATALDNYGNILWQQQEDAAEMIEQEQQRQRRRPLTLRQSASVGALYKNATAITTVNKRASGGELLQQRHQRDLFSGDLGIPEINTHVGSVVHTFETMAMLRRQAEEQQQLQQATEQQQKQQHLGKYTSTTATINALPTTQDHASTSASAFVLSATATATCHGTSNNKYNQLKRKAHESRHKIIQHSQQQLLAMSNNNNNNAQHLLPTKLTSSCSTQTLPAQQQQQHNSYSNVTQAATTAQQRRNTTSLQNMMQSPHHQPRPHVQEQGEHFFTDIYNANYRNLEDDYRKNLFGTISSRKFPTGGQNTTHNNNCNISPQSSLEDNDDAIIVNQAFDEIFAGYSCADDDDEQVATTNAEDEQVVSLSELDDDVFKPAAALINNNHNLGRPGSTPKRLLPLTHKKGPPPPPPPSSSTAAQKTKRNIAAALAAQKQRSTTLTNIFERIKSAQKPKHQRTLKKVPSESLLRNDQLQQQPSQPMLHKFPPQMNLHRELGEGEEATPALDVIASSPLPPLQDDVDFLRGSTVSQSFVHQLKKSYVSPKKSAAPPIPPVKPIARKTASTCYPSPSRNVLLFPKRSKSSQELLLDDLAVQTRKYYYASGFDDDSTTTTWRDIGVRSSGVGRNNTPRDISFDHAEI